MSEGGLADQTELLERIPRPRQRTPGSRFGTGLLAAIVLLLAGFTLCRLLGWDTFTPLAQTISFTEYALPLAVLVTVFAGVRRKWRTTVVGCLVVAGLFAAVAPRAIGGEAPADGVPLRLLTLNLRYGAATDGVLALVREHRPDVLSLQEVTPEALRELQRAGIDQWLPYHAARPHPGVAGTALYAKAWLTHERGVDRHTTFDMVRAETVHNGVKLDLVAAHPSPPVPGKPTERWRYDIDRLPRPTSGDGTVTILAGDFNATLDHSPLRRLIGYGYVDAAAAVGKGLAPTWQGGWVPPVTIDHVLVESGVGVRSYQVYDVAATDHRAIIVDLRLPRT
jgi:endonuclease/exonuclease/phosphatase (EEP) superfamily protein YafD